MCPDRQIFSLYVDGELPSPWKEKLETHLASCPECGARQEDYRRLSEVLGKAAVSETVLESAKDRVWLRLSGEQTERFRQPGQKRLWNRRVSLPLPAAAVAGLILVIAFVFAVRVPRNDPAPDSMAAAKLRLDMPEISPAGDMNGVLRYLGDSDSGDILVIQLPESKNFASFGEPTILKAADYRGPSSR